jgi:hypothetical protein
MTEVVRTQLEAKLLGENERLRIVNEECVRALEMLEYDDDTLPMPVSWPSRSLVREVLRRSAQVRNG